MADGWAPDCRKTVMRHIIKKMWRPAPHKKEILTVDEVALYTGLKKSYLYKLSGVMTQR